MGSRSEVFGGVPIRTVSLPDYPMSEGGYICIGGDSAIADRGDQREVVVMPEAVSDVEVASVSTAP